MRGYLTRKRVVIPKIKVTKKSSRNDNSLYYTPNSKNNKSNNKI